MPHRIVMCAAIGIALPWLCAGQRSDISLIRTGTFHQGEVSARDGERWLGLAPSGAGFLWRFFPVAVSAVEDPIVDKPGEKTGTQVVTRGADPIFLLRGAKGLARAKVRTAMFQADGLALVDRQSITLMCEGCLSVYTLRMTGRKGRGREGVAASRLILEGGGIEQILYEWPAGFSDQHCELVWAGDLDGDGKLDLYLMLSDHYNVQEATLFLSSRRRSRRLVERVAVFRTVGC